MPSAAMPSLRSRRRSTAPQRPRSPALLLAAALGALAAAAAAGPAAAEPPVVALDDALAGKAAGNGAAVVEILRGDEASVNAWQITDGMPLHLHREHEEIIVVRTGHLRARIGDRDVDLKPGDVFLVPKNTVHGARAVGTDPCTGVSVFAPAFDGRDRVPVPTPSATGAAPHG